MRKRPSTPPEKTKYVPKFDIIVVAHGDDTLADGAGDDFPTVYRGITHTTAKVFCKEFGDSLIVTEWFDEQQANEPNEWHLQAAEGYGFYVAAYEVRSQADILLANAGEYDMLTEVARVEYRNPEIP